MKQRKKYKSGYSKMRLLKKPHETTWSLKGEKPCKNMKFINYSSRFKTDKFKTIQGK